MPSSLYLYFGNDEYAVSEAARKTLDACVPPDQRATQLDIIDGAVDSADSAEACIRACIAGLQSMGLFATERTLWLKGASFLADNRTGRAERVQSALTDLTDRLKAGLPSGITLLITAPAVDKRRAFYKACQKGGEVQGFEIPERSYQAAREAGGRLQALAQRAGVRLSPAAQQVFLDRVGYESRRMASELEKLALFVEAGKPATEADVATICCRSRETEAWDLADAFGNRDLPETLRVLRRLLFERQSPIGLLIGLENRIRELLVYREGIDQRWLTRSHGARGDGATWGAVPASAETLFSEHMTRDPRAIHPFRVGILAGQAARFSKRELHSSLSLAIAAHERMVSSREPPESIIERFVTRALKPVRVGG